MKTNLIGSSSTLEGLIKQLNAFYFTSSIRIEGQEVFNSKGRINNVRVILKKGRYRMESFKQTNINMDLITAKVEAAKLSKDNRKKMYVNLLADGETEVSEKAGKEALHAYVNGSEVKTEEESTAQKEKSTIKKSTMQTKTKKAVKKPAKKVAKKAAPVKKTDTVKVAGTKTMSVKAIREQIKKGFFALNKDGKNLTPKYLEEMADQSREMIVSFVAKEKE